MIKCVFMLKRQPHLTRAQFLEYWRNQHAALAKDIYEHINNGVYRAGLAKSQAGYEEAFNRLFAAFDELETRLGKQRWLVGDRFTVADGRLVDQMVWNDMAEVLGAKLGA